MSSSHQDVLFALIDLVADFKNLLSCIILSCLPLLSDWLEKQSGTTCWWFFLQAQEVLLSAKPQPAAPTCPGAELSHLAGVKVPGVPPQARSCAEYLTKSGFPAQCWSYTWVQTKSFQLQASAEQICRWESGQPWFSFLYFLIHLILHILKLITTKASCGSFS